MRGRTRHFDGNQRVAKGKQIKRPAQPSGVVRPAAPNSNGGVAVTPAEPKALVVLRFVFLVVALGATAMLVGSHFHLFKAPGCGAGGGCDEAARSPFGSVPGMGWPVSFLGFSFYLAMLVALIATKGVVSGAMKHMARLGALVSAFYLFIIVLHSKQYLCAYCITSHVANFGFLATVELARSGAASSTMAAVLSLRTFVAATIGFVAATAGLAAGEAISKQRTQREADATTDDIINSARNTQAANNQTAPQTNQPAQPTSGAAIQPKLGPVNGESWESRAARLNLPVNIPETVTPQGFTGRWRIGDEDAPIRIVAFSDYQCPDCKRVEDEIRQILLTRNDVSFSNKHYLFNMECNPTFKARRNPHPNACWAARAAETAGLLRGNRGFWEMHFWLYDRKNAAGQSTPGAFVDAELVQGLTELGYDPVQFQEVMNSAAAGEWIDDDCIEGADLGLMFTPLIYINGKEFRQWHTPGELTRAVERIANANPPVGRALPTQDQPIKAMEKAVEDWQRSFVFSPDEMVRDSFSMARGSENAPLTVIFWGDYEDEYSREMNKMIMERYRGRDDVRVDFRHYPLNEECNMFAEMEKSKRGCRMAKVAEAAGRVGGPEAFWKMHDWLFQQGAQYDEEAMKSFARAIDLDADALVQQADGMEIRQTITGDAKLAQQKLAARAIPTVMVNWRLCPRWRLNDGRFVLPEILDAAEKEAGLR